MNKRNEVEPEKASEFEFLFTRAIEFRQETIYLIVVDRFFDGENCNNLGINPELYDPTPFRDFKVTPLEVKLYEKIGVSVYKIRFLKQKL